MRAGLVFALVFALELAACAYESPYHRAERLQQGAVKGLSATPIKATDSRWRALRTMRIDVYATRAHHRDAPDWEAQLEQRIADSNAVLRSFGIQLVIGQTRPWVPQKSHDDLDAALTELEALVPTTDADFVLGLVGPIPYALEVYSQIGRARVLGRHLVMRQMDSSEEMKAFRANFDMIDENELMRLYRGRKRHKEGSVLLHELGHTLGAIHELDRHAFMHATYDSKIEGFSESNRTIMSRVLEERGKPEDERDMEGLVKWMVAYLESPEAQGFRPQDRTEQLQALRASSAHAAVAQKAPAPGATPQTGAAATAPMTDAQATSGAAPDLRTDISALSAPDQVRFATAQAALSDNNPAEAWPATRALAKAYPNNYAVYDLACSLAMRGGVTMRELQQYCDRLAGLAGANVGRKR